MTKHRIWIGVVIIFFFLVAASFAQDKTDQTKAFSDVLERMYPTRETPRLTLVTQDNMGFGIGGIRDFVSMPNDPIITPELFLSGITCKADAVVYGHTASKTAHLSADETLVYTQYDFAVEWMVRNGTPRPIGQHANIQVVRPGGNIVLNGHNIEVRDFGFELLEKDKNYLLFLTYVPKADGFIVMDQGDLELSDHSVRKLSQGKDGRIFKDGDNAASVLSKMREIAGKCAPSKAQPPIPPNTVGTGPL